MSYTPRAGSVAQRLIEHLQAAQAGTRMNVQEIAAQFEVLPTNAGTALHQAVDAGLLEITKEGRTRYYHLPEEPTEEERAIGELAINSDSTGDLWFTGAHINSDDGAVLLTQAQLQQLVSYATTPPVRLSVASEVAN